LKCSRLHGDGSEPPGRFIHLLSDTRASPGRQPSEELSLDSALILHGYVMGLPVTVDFLGIYAKRAREAANEATRAGS
jgi:hypothetical protein